MTRTTTMNAAPAASAGWPRLAKLWRTRPAAPEATLNLALQGGGAHGAFTWGVLDALLAREGLAFEGLSGSSAGAMNACILAEGWRKGGRDGARQALADFWLALAEQLPFDLMVTGEGENTGLTEASKLMMKWMGSFSPQQINPFELNVLRDLLLRRIDFDALRAESPFKLFIAATQTNTGKLRIFRESELTVDVLLASSCLPRVHHPVTIDGEPYWDGGYTANPAIFPLFYDCLSRDILLVLLSPLRHDTTPRTVDEIEARALELAFSANLMREMRAFLQARAFPHSAWLPAGRLERRLRELRFHMISTQDLESTRRTETRLIAHRPFLELLRDQGRARAEAWWLAHGGAVGRRGSVELEQWFA